MYTHLVSWFALEFLYKSCDVVEDHEILRGRYRSKWLNVHQYMNAWVFKPGSGDPQQASRGL